MRSRLLVGSLLGLAFATPGRADVDADRAAWRYRRRAALSEPGSAPLFAALALPPQLLARSAPDLRDVRIVAGDGTEIPWLLDRPEVERTPTYTARVDPKSASAPAQTVWTLRFEERRSFDRLDLEVDGQEFTKNLRVEAEAEGGEWRTLRDDAVILDRRASLHVRHTSVAFQSVVTAAALRVVANDGSSPRLGLRNATVSLTSPRGAERWNENVLLERLEAPPGWSRYRLGALPGLPAEELVVAASDSVFSRNVRLIEEAPGASGEKRTLGEARLYHLRLEPPAAAVESLAFKVSRPGAGRLVLEIENGDSPPLHDVTVSAAGFSPRMLFLSKSAPFTLYYGNHVTRGPAYDLAALREHILSQPKLAAVDLGPEESNPSFQEPPRLQFVARSGAALDTRGWRELRRVEITGGEDLYSLTLAAADLGYLEPDLRDLRIADSQDRQVPYLLDQAVGEAKVPLTPTVLSREPRASRYALEAPAGGGRPLALPLVALELGIEQGFFSRGARLTTERTGRGRPDAEQTLYAGTLSRRAGEKDPLRIPLDGTRVARMTLRVDEGDDEPLALRRVEAAVLTPRIAFKAAAGSYRLLLGNERVDAPRYDIAGMRRELLAYSSVGAQAFPVEANPSYRRSARDYLRTSPPTVVLWGTLVGAVVALLLLTARILKTTSPSPPE